MTTAVQLVPIEKIRVINARSRNKGKFREIVENISRVGLKKPITVSRNEGSDVFDLVCGQGRLEAFVACGAIEIPAIVVDIPLEDRLLRSLVENLTRRTRSGVEMARDITSLKDRGYSPAEIATMVGVSETHVAHLARLVENGEDRLISAVERGDLPISVAIEITATDDTTMQKSLQEAYESGQLRGKSLLRVRRIIDERRARGRGMKADSRIKKSTASSHDLVRALRKETHKQEMLVKKARLCEQQLRFIISALKDLMANDSFVNLLRAEKLDSIPRCLDEMIRK